MSRPKSDFKHQNDNLICLFFFNIGMSGGGNSRQGRIVGGWELKPHSMPWQAAIANIGNVQYCGGTIICPRYVMSAAHCSWNDQTRAFVDESDFVVLIGAHEKPPPPQGPMPCTKYRQYTGQALFMCNFCVVFKATCDVWKCAFKSLALTKCNLHYKYSKFPNFARRFRII